MYLRSLNLADNRVGSEGVKALLKVLSNRERDSKVLSRRERDPVMIALIEPESLEDQVWCGVSSLSKLANLCLIAFIRSPAQIAETQNCAEGSRLRERWVGAPSSTHKHLLQALPVHYLSFFGMQTVQ